MWTHCIFYLENNAVSFWCFQSPFAVRQRWIPGREARAFNKSSHWRFVKSAKLRAIQFIRAVPTVILLVTEESFVDAFSIGTKVCTFGACWCSAHKWHKVFALGKLPWLEGFNGGTSGGRLNTSTRFSVGLTLSPESCLNKS